MYTRKIKLDTLLLINNLLYLKYNKKYNNKNKCN